jgi:phosphatidylserine decarboxylase
VESARGDRAILASYGKKTWLPLCLALAAAAIACRFYCIWGSLLFALGLLFTAWFFRDPERSSDAPQDALLAPADGVVVEIAQAEEPAYIGAPARKIAIFMSVLDVHVNRCPCDARVEWTRREAGRFLNALSARASIENERVLVALRRQGKPLLLKLVAGLIARRIVCPLRQGDALARGQRLGMIKFGSRVELFLPASENFEVSVRLGQRVRAGETVIGVWR